jgi:hypothetical protein
MAEAANSITNTFNSISFKGILKFTFQAVVIGFLIGGIADFTFFHNHPAGQAIISSVNETMLSFYDGVVKSVGFAEYARPTEFLTAGATCGSFDPVTGIPTPC